MREFILYLIAEFSIRKVVSITGITEKTLKKYLDGWDIRQSKQRDMASRIDVWVSEIWDQRVDACCGKDFINNSKE